MDMQQAVLSIFFVTNELRHQHLTNLIL